MLALYYRHERAHLAPAADRAKYFETAFSRERNRKLDWLWRSFCKLGGITVDQVSGAEAPRAFEDFLKIEASGWKGRGGGAISLHDPLRAFARAAIENLAKDGKVRIDRILKDGQPVAASVLLLSGESGWLWRIAYLEEFARYSPGFNVKFLTESLLKEPSIVSVDSCTMPDHPMINRIWSERLKVGFCMIGVGPESREPFDFALRCEAFTHQNPPYYIRGR